MDTQGIQDSDEGRPGEVRDERRKGLYDILVVPLVIAFAALCVLASVYQKVFGEIESGYRPDAELLEKVL